MAALRRARPSLTPNQAELFQSVAGQRRRQSILCRSNAGCGFFGLALRSDAAARFDALEDNQIAADRASLVEVVGCDIRSSAAVGVFLYGSTENYVEGNYIHHTWADQIHHTNGARQSWVWNNFILNDQVSAAQTSCGQDIAADGVFAAAMQAEYRAPIDTFGSWFYRRLHWEAGVVGQQLYLEAEASGIRATGIGCFFDELTHRTFALKGDAFQVLYHFTVGAAIEDVRLQTVPPYQHLHKPEALA